MDGAAERSGTMGQAKDLAAGAGEIVPLNDKGNFEGRPHLNEVTPEMVTAFMREFEKWSPLLRYKEAEGWHTVDRLGVRHGLVEALRALPARSRVLP